MKKTLPLIILLSSFVNCTTVAASELNVIVSIPPLHSLVSSLMEGAGEPTLLFDGDIDKTTALDPFQKSQMITADMMVWVGSGLESPLEQALDELPALGSRVLTLSQYLPLLPGSETNDNYDLSREQSRNLSFWTDPRLAVIAVRIITPKLVKLDPDNQELYLDNEIALVKKLKNLEAEIFAALAPYTVTPDISFIKDDHYFTRRFIASSSISTDEGFGFRKISIAKTPSCTNSLLQSEKLSVGPSLYFDTMRLKMRAIETCMMKRDNRAVYNQTKDRLATGRPEASTQNYDM